MSREGRSGNRSLLGLLSSSGSCETGFGPMDGPLGPPEDFGATFFPSL